MYQSSDVGNVCYRSVAPLSQPAVDLRAHGNIVRVVTSVMFIVEALRHYRSQLSTFEHTEMLDFSQVWYLGLDAKKIEAAQGAAQNNGYDDESGSYIKVRERSLINKLQIMKFKNYCSLFIKLQIIEYSVHGSRFTKSVSLIFTIKLQIVEIKFYQI